VPHVPNTSLPTNYSEALAEYNNRLQTSSGSPCYRDDLRRARENYRDQYERMLIEPLSEPTAPPVQQNLTAVFAHLFRVLHEGGPLLEAEMKRAGNAGELPEILLSESLRQRSLIVRDVLKLCKELGYV